MELRNMILDLLLPAFRETPKNRRHIVMNIVGIILGLCLVAVIIIVSKTSVVMMA